MVSIADYGNIVVTRQPGATGRGVERLTYEIKDGPYVCVSGRYYADQLDCPPVIGSRIEIGPYRLRAIEVNFWMDSVIAIQEKWPLWWIAVAWHRSNKLLDICYRRLIVTLAVWGLADYSEATVPYIGDIHIVQRVRKLFNGKRISN